MALGACSAWAGQPNDRVLRIPAVPRLQVEHCTAVDERARPRSASGTLQGQLLLQRLLSLHRYTMRRRVRSSGAWSRGSANSWPGRDGSRKVIAS